MAERGISNKSLPLPLKNDAETSFNLDEPVTIKKSFIVTPVFTNSPTFGAIDAVTLPLAILFISKESAACGILNNPSPLPEKNPLPDGIVILPLTLIEPVN